MFDLEKHTIFATLHGSRAYGTNIASSDSDFKGVAIPPKEYFLGYFSRFEQAEQLVSKGHPHDKTIYDIRKFLNLAANTNPNIIEVLFTDPSDHTVTTKWSERLLASRDLFISKKARFTFSGYAYGQLKRIKSHRAWLLNPPTHQPLRTEFGLPSDTSKAVDVSTMNAVDSLSSEGHTFSEEVMAAIQKEKKYSAALQYWKQYQEWKATRNADRAELEAKHGFDSKHGMHLIRLQRMCVEILEGKGVLVKRPDFEELLAIRHGGWTYDQVVEESDRLEAKVVSLYETSTLPAAADGPKIDALCISLVEDFLSSM